MQVQLTEEQQVIVNHNYGPSLVFAVAGSGKTTAMVHRIERLVREKIFAPHKILATSFSKAAVEDIQHSLLEWSHCSQVKVSTLHALGYKLILQARSLGYLQLSSTAINDMDKKAQHILHKAIKEARSKRTSYFRELDSFDHEDFLNYVGSCKGNLLYANLDEIDLPAEGLKLAKQAEPPADMDWYLKLYQLFERVRKKAQQITFDDMLMTGWELLIRYPDMKKKLQAQQHCVLVDEFQDVNLVQSELLSLLVEEHQNYMVIGDDDQTIYEWRGAAPQFILNFEKRYQATKFLIKDNFRCRASHIALANSVIKHNKQREPKLLSLTKGFSGKTFFHASRSSVEMTSTLLNEIEQAINKGVPLSDIAILVRFYAQTPQIEQFLINKQIPYKIVGNTPFYQRPEIQVFMSYLRIAFFDRKLMTGQELQPHELYELKRNWRRIYNRPNRYVSADIADTIIERVVLKKISLSNALILGTANATASVETHLYKLSTVLRWLSSQIMTIDAEKTLEELNKRLEYTKFLKKSSGFPETGEGRAKNVEAFWQYAKGKGTSVEFIKHIDHISFKQKDENLTETDEYIKIMTIFRAKGLEWSYVFIPNCNDGIIPFRGNYSNLEEERRLFYVALTRAKNELHLLSESASKISRFLEEAQYERVLDAVSLVSIALKKEKEHWNTKDALALARYVRILNFDRYISFWWDASISQKKWISSQVQKLFKTAQQRNILKQLGLKIKDIELWESFGYWEETITEKDFPDLEKYLIAPKEKTSKNTKNTKGFNPVVVKIEEKKDDPDYVVGSRVKHPKFGAGKITKVLVVNENLRLTIEFDKVGTKKIAPLYTTLTPLH